MAKTQIEETVATGRRKRAVSSVRLRPGSGKVNVNGQSLDQYFPLKIQQNSILQPLELLEKKGAYDLIVRVTGGGKEGQVIATRLGLARALLKEDEDRKHDLKVKGFLTRDPRRKERKKYGHKKARKSFQFSKR